MNNCSYWDLKNEEKGHARLEKLPLAGNKTKLEQNGTLEEPANRPEPISAVSMRRMPAYSGDT